MEYDRMFQANLLTRVAKIKPLWALYV